jgi:hypothetical protein
MKQYLFGAVLAFAGLVALAPAARAQALVVHIQQDFVAGGKTLPAGNYTIARNVDGAGQVLLLRDRRSGASAFLVATTKDAPVAERNQVTLLRSGDALYLSEIATDAAVFTFAPPRAAKQRDLSSASGK